MQAPCVMVILQMLITAVLDHNDKKPNNNYRAEVKNEQSLYPEGTGLNTESMMGAD
jgi:hypothetical protein